MLCQGDVARVLLDAVDLGVVVLNECLEVEVWNRWMCRRTRVGSEEVMGRRFTEIFPCLRERGMEKAIQHVFRTGSEQVLSPFFHEYFVPIPVNSPSPGEEPMQQHTRLIPVKVAGATRGVVALITDCTEAFDFEENLLDDLHKTRDQLIQSERAKALAEVAGAASHEMSQPLAVVVGNLELAQTRSCPTEVADMIKKAADGARRMVVLLGKIRRSRSYRTKRYAGHENIVDFDRTEPEKCRPVRGRSGPSGAAVCRG